MCGFEDSPFDRHLMQPQRSRSQPLGATEEPCGKPNGARCAQCSVPRAQFMTVQWFRLASFAHGAAWPPGAARVSCCLRLCFLPTSQRGQPHPSALTEDRVEPAVASDVAQAQAVSGKSIHPGLDAPDPPDVLCTAGGTPASAARASDASAATPVVPAAAPTARPARGRTSPRPLLAAPLPTSVGTRQPGSRCWSIRQTTTQRVRRPSSAAPFSTACSRRTSC